MHKNYTKKTGKLHIGLIFITALLTFGLTCTSINETAGDAGDVDISRHNLRSDIPMGEFSISGTVFDDAAGKPIKDAEVYLFSERTFGSYFYYTGEAGDFSFTDLPAGSYALFVRKDGYERYERNSFRVTASEESIILSKYKPSEKEFVINLKKGCIITGVVKVPGGSRRFESVFASYKDPKSGRFFDETAFIQEDGSFKFESLKPAAYYLCVSDWEGMTGGVPYSRIYYPGAFSLETAKPVILKKAGDKKWVTLDVKNSGGVSVSGVITDEKTGEPVPGALVTVHNPGVLFDFVTAYTDAEGKYNLEGLNTGSFLLHLDAAHKGFVRYREPIVIWDGNISKDFSLKRGITIKGKVTAVDGSPVDIEKSYGNVRVLSSPEYKESTSSGSFTGPVNKFSPGTYNHRDSLYLLGEGYYNHIQFIFPTESSFVVEGLPPGTATLDFTPITTKKITMAGFFRDNKKLSGGKIQISLEERLFELTLILKK